MGRWRGPGKAFRIIQGGLAVESVRANFLLARGSYTQGIDDGMFHVQGGLSIRATDSFEFFLDLMKAQHFNALLIDASWGGGMDDAVWLLRTIRMIELHSGRRPLPVVVCTGKAVGWRADALDKLVWVYELPEHTEKMPGSFFELLRQFCPITKDFRRSGHKD